MVSAYAMRIPAVILMFTVAVAALGSWQVLGNQQASRAQWASAGDAIRIMLSGTAIDRNNVDAMELTMGRWLRTCSRTTR
jgi:hypothetical protein